MNVIKLLIIIIKKKNDETLEMDRPHSPKAFYQHDKTSPVLESPGKEEKGMA